MKDVEDGANVVLFACILLRCYSRSSNTATAEA